MKKNKFDWKKIWPYIVYTVSFCYLTLTLIIPPFFEYSIEELIKEKILVYRLGMSAIIMTAVGLIVKTIKSKFIK